MSKYEAVCKQCGWKHSEGDSPKLLNVPSRCTGCQSDMVVRPVQEENVRSHSYEVIVQCKENGAVVMEGFLIKASELLEPEKQRQAIIAKRLSESIANIMTKPMKLNQLLSR